MIRLPSLLLPDAVQNALDGYQQEIDSLPDYPTRVTQAKSQFEARNTKTNSTFKVVRQTLTEMCSGVRRCCYCEDSAATDVEHIKPKNFYPELVFVWDNYLYACGRCNSPKGNRCDIYSASTKLRVSLRRQKGTPVIPPEVGDPLLINPRQEDPLEFMILDLRGTFYFLPRHPKGSTEYERAQYTIDLLQLNEADLLPAARREALDNYYARLHRYITQRDAGADVKELDHIRLALQRMQHPTVWHEMKRQAPRLPILGEPFEQASEAMAW